MGGIRDEDGETAGTPPDAAGRLNLISNRTNMMAIDAMLNCIPKGEAGWTEAALEAKIIARRMRQAAEDFRASVPD